MAIIITLKNNIVSVCDDGQDSYDTTAKVYILCTLDSLEEPSIPGDKEAIQRIARAFQDHLPSKLLVQHTNVFPSVSIDRLLKQKHTTVTIGTRSPGAMVSCARKVHSHLNLVHLPPLPTLSGDDEKESDDSPISWDTFAALIHKYNLSLKCNIDHGDTSHEHSLLKDCLCQELASRRSGLDAISDRIVNNKDEIPNQDLNVCPDETFATDVQALLPAVTLSNFDSDTVINEEDKDFYSQFHNYCLLEPRSPKVTEQENIPFHPVAGKLPVFLQDFADADQWSSIVEKFSAPAKKDHHEETLDISLEQSEILLRFVDTLWDKFAKQRGYQRLFSQEEVCPIKTLKQVSMELGLKF